ncbi:reprolysin-like metallopeptidase [Flavobacterium sp.]|uniref:zinc-dependent metalloprotease n=1 Tax=Flavobacterium sp. TaxID=239 RepID=UPI00261E98D2|nr:zinc-dependent metalloprotease family protein [Flavobacterium sp.]
MKKQLLFVFASVFAVCQLQAQTNQVWSAHKENSGKLATDSGVAREAFPKEFKLYDLDIAPLRAKLFSTIGNMASKKATIISLPNADGQIEQFEVYEASNFESDLQAQYPDIRAYSGKGITDKYATLKLSISPLGLQTMVFRTDKESEFIEVYSQDRTVYAVFKSQRQRGGLAWACGTDGKKIVVDADSQLPNTNRSSAGQLKTMRLAQSCDAEYSVYYQKKLVPAATVGVMATSLAAINATLTRCNGVYEKDLALHLNLVASSTNMIFLDPATDIYPAYNSNNRNWNKILQNNLSSRLTGVGTTLAANNAAYDIGHMFGSSGGGGDAGCIGCVCEDDTSTNNDLHKGSGITSPADDIPEGDNFDIDYVVHEVGHQLGGNHTYTFADEGTGVNVEVGSGITIMGYAGITSADFTNHSIDAYHAVTIAQIQANLATVSCPVTTNITANNVAPVVVPSANITIPISTPFALVTAATDANSDPMTYSWEQMDVPAAAQFGNSTVSGANATKASGPVFASWAPTASNTRYFPKMATVMSNLLVTAQVNGDAGMNSEALLSIARTLNFRVTVRDNAPYSSIAPIKAGQTSFANMTVATNVTGGAFSVSSQNSAGISYQGGSAQTVTWVAGSTASAPFNATNVDILISFDSGLNWTMLLAGTPNDGTQSVTLPNPGSDQLNCRIMVRSAVTISPQSYFFNVNRNAFAITNFLGVANYDFQDFNLYPNPNKGSFNVRFTSNSGNDIKINVHDIRGRQVYVKSFTNNGTFNQNINLEKVQAGVYLVSIMDGTKKTVKRIVVE